MKHCMPHFGGMFRNPHNAEETVPGGGVNTPPFPLRLAPEGAFVRITALTGVQEFRDRLAGMGLSVGARVEVIQNRGDGQLLLARKGSRLFLGGGMAHRIQVVSETRRKP